MKWYYYQAKPNVALGQKVGESGCKVASASISMINFQDMLLQQVACTGAEKQPYLATSCVKCRACDLMAMMCLGFAEDDTDFDAAAPALSAKPSMLGVSWRKTTAESSLTLPCLVCSKAISVLKHAFTTSSARAQIGLRPF